MANSYNNFDEINRLLQFQKDDFPQLQVAIKNENIIIFLGAGVSKFYGCPLWNELAIKMVNKLQQEHLISYAEEEILSVETTSDPRKVITICYGICKKENSQAYANVISECFNFNREYNDNFHKIYDKIFSINARAYLTTNIDLGITYYKNDPLKMSQIEAYNCTLPKDKEKIELAGYNIVKDGNIIYLHGNVENIEKCIMPLDKYLSFYGDGYNFVQELFHKLNDCTLVFIGYSLNEWDVIEKIYKISRGQKRETGLTLSGYILSPIYSHELTKFNLEKIYYETFGIEVIPYIIDNEGYEKLLLVLENLAKAINKDRISPYSIKEDIDNIESKTLGAEEINYFLDKIQRKTIYEDDFFRKISKLEWFDELIKRNYFKPNPDTAPKERREKQYYIPYWNVLPYLERVSEKAKLSGNKKYIDELLNIIKEVTEYHLNNNKCLDNFYTWQSFAKILVNIPNNRISIDIIDFISIWLDTKFNNTLVPIEILKNLLPKFLDSDKAEDLKKAEKIVNIVTKIKCISKYTEQGKRDIKERYKHIFDKPEGERTEEEKIQIEHYRDIEAKDAVTIVYGYFLNEKFLVQKKAYEVGEKCSEKIIYTLARRIKQIIRNEYPGKDYDLSYIWIKSLLDAPGVYLSAKTIITLILRDILISKAGKDKEATEKILNRFIKKYNHPLFKRLALLVISTRWDDYNDIFWGMIKDDNNGKLFNDLHYKQEMYILLQNNVGKFSEEQKEKIKNIIEKMVPEKEHHEEEYRERYSAYQKQEWYSAVKSDDYFKPYYEKYKNITRTEEDISFKQPEARWGFGESPQPEEEIMKMSNKELALYLTTFKTVDFWKGPTIRGLAEAIKNTAANHPEKFTDDLEPLLKAEYLYVSNILWGIAQALRNKKEINRGNIFSFILKYIEPADFWEDKYKIEDSGDILPLEENHLSVIRAVSNLIKEDTRYELNPFLDKHFVLAQKILFLILDKLIPQKNKINDEPYHDNFLLNAANSLLGTITEALASLTLKVAQTGKNTGKEQTIELGKELINKYEEILKEEITEGYFWLGAYLLNFYHADKKWTEDRIKSIDVKHLFWEPFMSGYLLLSKSIDKDLYNLMRNNYLESVNYDFKTKETREMLVQHICIEYLNGVEEINGDDSLFKKLLDKWDRFIVGEIIRFFWTQRDYLVTAPQNQNMDNINKAKKRIIDFWRWVYKNKYKGKGQNILKKEDEEILSELSMLTVFLSKIDSKNCEWLKFSALYATNINISFFIEYLNILKDKGNSVDYLGNIFLKILEKNTPTFRQEDIVSIVEFLYTEKKKEQANEICNTYAERGHNFLEDVYRKYME